MQFHMEILLIILVVALIILWVVWEIRHAITQDEDL